MRPLFDILNLSAKRLVLWSILTLTLYVGLWLLSFSVLAVGQENSNAETDADYRPWVLIPFAIALAAIAGGAAWLSLASSIKIIRHRTFVRVGTCSMACLLILAGLCVLFRLRSIEDLSAYAGMMQECHPVWKTFALRTFARGSSSKALLARYPPSSVEEFGRYGLYSYQKRNLTNGISWTLLTVISRDGRLISAGAGSCTWRFSFFQTEDPQLERDYAAYVEERRAKAKAREGER